MDGISRTHQISPTLLLFEVPDHTACDMGSFQVEAGRLCCILVML